MKYAQVFLRNGCHYNEPAKAEVMTACINKQIDISNIVCYNVEERSE